MTVLTRQTDKNFRDDFQWGRTHWRSWQCLFDTNSEEIEKVSIELSSKFHKTKKKLRERVHQPNVSEVIDKQLWVFKLCYKAGNWLEIKTTFLSKYYFGNTHRNPIQRSMKISTGGWRIQIIRNSCPFLCCLMDNVGIKKPMSKGIGCTKG